MPLIPPAVIGKIEEWAPSLLKALRWCWAFIRRATLPSHVLTIVPNERESWWATPATVAGMSAIQLNSSWFVTNRSARGAVRIIDVKITRTFPRRWTRFPRRTQVTPAMTFHFSSKHRAVGDTLPPSGHADLQVLLMPLGEPPQDDSIVVGWMTFTDHLGNRYHKRAMFKNVRTRHLGDRQPV